MIFKSKPRPCEITRFAIRWQANFPCIPILLCFGFMRWFWSGLLVVRATTGRSFCVAIESGATGARSIYSSSLQPACGTAAGESACAG